MAIIIREHTLPSSNYHLFHCSNETRGADVLFERYDNDKSQLLDLLTYDPEKLVRILWSENSILAIDHHCLCSSGRHNVRTPFICTQCKSIGRLYDYRDNSYKFVVESGNKIGTIFIIDCVENIFPSLKITKNFFPCDYNEVHSFPKDIMVLSGDKESINILVQLVVENIMNVNYLTHYQTWVTVFMCKYDLYYLYEENEIGVVPNQDNILEIIKQFLVIITVLKDYHFVNDMYISKMIFSKESLSYDFYGYHICSEFTMKLADFKNSTIVYNDKLLRPKILFQKPIFGCPIIDVSQSDLGTSFRLTKESIQVYDNLRRSGYDLFADTYHCYQFMISLMCDSSYYDAILRNEFCTQMWKMMWSVDEYDEVMTSILKWHDNDDAPDRHNYNDIICNKWLRCDIIERCWQLL